MKTERNAAHNILFRSGVDSRLPRELVLVLGLGLDKRAAARARRVGARDLEQRARRPFLSESVVYTERAVATDAVLK